MNTLTVIDQHEYDLSTPPTHTKPGGQKRRTRREATGPGRPDGGPSSEDSPAGQLGPPAGILKCGFRFVRWCRCGILTYMSPGPSVWRWYYNDSHGGRGVGRGGCPRGKSVRRLARARPRARTESRMRAHAGECGREGENSRAREGWAKAKADARGEGREREQ